MKKIMVYGLILLLTIFIVGCNNNTFDEDAELCEMKGFEYYDSGISEFVKCFDNGILVNVHYTEYDIMKHVQKNKIDCKEVYIEHLVKVGEDSSFELTKCKENGLTIDVKEIMH